MSVHKGEWTMREKPIRLAFATLSFMAVASLAMPDPSKAPVTTNSLFAVAVAGESWRFRLEEATIADVHRAFRAKQLTATQLVEHYLKRIKAYSGTCVQGALDPATGLHLGDITPIPNAGQVNAFITLNLKENKRVAWGFPDKMKRTHSGPDDAKIADALDRAGELDTYFARTGRFAGPLHGIPIAVKDNYDTFDLRTTAGALAAYANDRPPNDATVVEKLRAAGAIVIGKTNFRTPDLYLCVFDKARKIE